MTVYVFRDGILVAADRAKNTRLVARSEFPSPHVSIMPAYQSPVDDRWITSWRQRDADMKAVDCIDPRDAPQTIKDKADARRAKQLKRR